MDELSGVRKLQNLQRQFERSLTENDFPKAIEAVLECRNAISKFKHLTSVQELANILQERYNVVQEKLDASLNEACRTFNVVNYERILLAYPKKSS